MKILYVEPESTTREFILEVIRQDNVEVEVCTSPAEALQFLDFEIYDLIITDFRLPQNGGVNILRKLIKKKLFPKLIYFSSVRPRRSRNLKKLLKRQNIFYVPRGMTSVSIDGLSKEISNFEVGIFQRMFEAYAARKRRGLNSEKTVLKSSAKSSPQMPSDDNKVRQLLEVELDEGGEAFGNSVEDFGRLDLGEAQVAPTEGGAWDFESTRSDEELAADWEMFQKRGMAINELDYGFKEKEYQEESEADWGSVDANVIKNLEDMDEDEGQWLKNVQAQTADWSLEKNKAGEEEADWSLEKNKAGEEEADWSLEKNKLGEEEADWSLEKNKAGEEEADWSLKQHKELQAEKFSGYVEVALSRLKVLEKSPCDIYFKLGERKMLKMINLGDDIRSDFFQQMEDKGAEKMFLMKSEFQLFDDVFGKMLNQKLKSAKVSKVEKIQVMGSQLGFDYVHKQMQAIGISESTAKIAKSTVENTLEVVLKQRNLFSALKELLIGKSYLSEHSLMAVTISSEILKKLNWVGSGNIDKIAMAGLFHDSMIRDEKLARLNRRSQVENLSRPEQELVWSHADLAAKEMESSKYVDQDIINIVRNHHERPQGEGFPNGFQPQVLSNLTCIFILAEEIVELLYAHKFDVLQARESWQANYEFFNIGNFKKPLEIAKSILG